MKKGGCKKEGVPGGKSRRGGKGGEKGGWK